MADNVDVVALAKTLDDLRGQYDNLKNEVSRLSILIDGRPDLDYQGLRNEVRELVAAVNELKDLEVRRQQTNKIILRVATFFGLSTVGGWITLGSLVYSIWARTL